MTPAIVEALRTFTTELMRSEEFRTALRDVVSEMLAAPRPEAVEMVPIATFARERSLNAATVRQMAKDGRIEALRIGKRQWRVRRDSPIQPIRREERAASGRELVPPLAERSADMDRIIAEYAADAIAGLAAPAASFTADDNVWVRNHAAGSLAEIEAATLRLVTLRTSRNVSHAAERLGMRRMSLFKWLARRGCV